MRFGRSEKDWSRSCLNSLRSGGSHAEARTEARTLFIGTLPALMSVRCGAEVVEAKEDLGAIEQAFGSSPCATVNADQVFSGPMYHVPLNLIRRATADTSLT